MLKINKKKRKHYILHFLYFSKKSHLGLSFLTTVTNYKLENFKSKNKSDNDSTLYWLPTVII